MSIVRVKVEFFQYLVLLLLSTYLRGAGQPSRVVWQKDLNRGYLEIHRIEIRGDGKAKYEFKQDEGATIEVDFQLKFHTVGSLLEMFTQADFLNEAKDFVSLRQVADTGTRTIRLESGSRIREVVFMHTEDKTLREIADFFDQLSRQERSLFEMNLALKHDPLGVPKQLELLEQNLRRKKLIDPERFILVLKKILADSSLMNLARKQARRLLSEIDSQSSQAK